jgi:hypothetical protein
MFRCQAPALSTWFVPLLLTVKACRGKFKALAPPPLRLLVPPRPVSATVVPLKGQLPLPLLGGRLGCTARCQGVPKMTSHNMAMRIYTP